MLPNSRDMRLLTGAQTRQDIAYEEMTEFVESRERAGIIHEQAAFGQAFLHSN